MPPWCDEAGICEPPRCDASEADPLPCGEPPFYGCWETEEGPIVCVDPPVSECWEEEGGEGLIACLTPMPEVRKNDSVKRGLKAKKAKAKARAKAKAARVKARKAKAAKAKKAKAQELKRR